MAHGAGGRLSDQLITGLFRQCFDDVELARGHDGAVLALEHEGTNPGKLAFTTDSYVVNPLFFPGGDIGSLAVFGTANDLAMCGARPLFLSVAFILEEGLEMAILARVVQSMAAAAKQASIRIVTGDTKVVERGHGDGIFISTSGCGLVPDDRQVGPENIAPGDAILVNGDIGRHGIAVMASRQGLSFETPLESDCAPLVDAVEALFDAELSVHCMRDMTRGGLASTVVEIAERAGMDAELEEADIPVSDSVRGACEILGFDPLYVANEGRFALYVPETDTEAALAILRKHHPQARRVGKVLGLGKGRVGMRSLIGGIRPVDMLVGDQLPRIC